MQEANDLGKIGYKVRDKEKIEREVHGGHRRKGGGVQEEMKTKRVLNLFRQARIRPDEALL